MQTLHFDMHRFNLMIYILGVLMLFKSNDALLNMVNMSNILKRLPDDFMHLAICICLRATTEGTTLRVILTDHFTRPNPLPSIRKGTGTALQVDQPMPSLLTAFITHGKFHSRHHNLQLQTACLSDPLYTGKEVLFASVSSSSYLETRFKSLP